MSLAYFAFFPRYMVENRYFSLTLVFNVLVTGGFVGISTCDFGSFC